MDISLSLQKAAQAWCTDKNKHKELDADLASAFAEILDESNAEARNKATDPLYALIGELRDYLYHDSHRCFTTKTCHCGLNALLEEHGMAKVDRLSSALGKTADA